MDKLKTLITNLNTRQKIAALGALIVIFNYESFRYISCEAPHTKYSGRCVYNDYSTLEQNLFWTALAIFIAAVYFLGDKKED